MKRLKLVAVLLCGGLLSACDITGLESLEKSVTEHNASIDKLVKGYQKEKTVAEKNSGAIIQYILKGAETDTLGEDVSVPQLNETDAEDFKGYIVSSNTYHTAKGYEGLTQIIILAGYTKQMLVEVVWLDKKVVYLEYTVKDR